MTTEKMGLWRGAKAQLDNFPKTIISFGFLACIVILCRHRKFWQKSKVAIHTTHTKKTPLSKWAKKGL